MAKTANKRRNIWIVSLALVSAVALICGSLYIYHLLTRPRVADSLEIEAGASLPPAAAFLLQKGDTGSYVLLTAPDTSKPGTYTLTILIGKKRYDTKLIVTDSIAPEAETAVLDVWTGERPAAADFLRSVRDATAVTATFTSVPDTETAGTKQVGILLRDAGDNTAYVNATLRVYDTVETVEAATATSLSAYSARDFVIGPEEGADFLFALGPWPEGTDLRVPGLHPISILLNGKPRESTLMVPDRNPPRAAPLAVSKWLGESADAAEFVWDIMDESEVTVRFETEPDTTIEGEQPVTVILTDATGNSTAVVSTLVCKRDEPPVFSGRFERSAFIGDTIAYRSGIIVTDDRDSELSIAVDSSAVDRNKAGTYPVYYSVTDSGGNTVSAKGSITIFAVSEEEVYARIDAILADILKDGMTQYEQAHAIYKYIKRKLGYSNSSIKDSVIFAAYRGLRDNRGDCYVYYALSEMLLTRAGIPNLPIRRIPGTKTAHYWCLVNVGDGWHHFDAVPHVRGGETFMITQSQAEAFNKARGRNYYNFDASLYPEIVP